MSRAAQAPCKDIRLVQLLQTTRPQPDRLLLSCNGLCTTVAGVHPTWLATMVSPVHADVMDEVCCPANSPAMSIPVISSSFRWRPPYAFLYLASMNTCRGSKRANEAGDSHTSEQVAKEAIRLCRQVSSSRGGCQPHPRIFVSKRLPGTCHTAWPELDGCHAAAVTLVLRLQAQSGGRQKWTLTWSTSSSFVPVALRVSMTFLKISATCLRALQAAACLRRQS